MLYDFSPSSCKTCNHMLQLVCCVCIRSQIRHVIVFPQENSDGPFYSSVYKKYTKIINGKNDVRIRVHSKFGVEQNFIQEEIKELCI